ncbi:MAG: rhomboid family intramembrane serine protease [Deltaproteobacteria bacterium]|jgi:membrane associated rhomboid family serine protease|nr:rhomboid family intramembrane serine protease [Deltaproteobacteria bacterium]
MIFPWPRTFLSRKDINFTNIFILLNMVLYLTFFLDSDSEKIKSELFNSFGVSLTTEYYQKHVLVNRDQKHYKDLLSTFDFSNPKHHYLISSFAVRDQFFMNEIEKRKFDRDSIKWDFWISLIDKYKAEVKEQVLFIMGLSHGNKRTFSWITYQFSHMTFLHLVSNMIFVFLIGYWIEGALGSLGFVLLYLFSGIAGGLFYLYFSPNTLLPMVGASGSVSGMIAFYCFFEPKLRTRFFYFLSPQKNYYGYIYLPTLLIVPMFLLTDLSSFLSQIPGLSSGVAFTAHIGGALFGGLLGLSLRKSLALYS